MSSNHFAMAEHESVLEAVSHPFIVNLFDEHKLIVRSGLALVHVTCDMTFVGSRQLSCLKTSWVYQLSTRFGRWNTDCGAHAG